MGGGVWCGGIIKDLIMQLAGVPAKMLKILRSAHPGFEFSRDTEGKAIKPKPAELVPPLEFKK